MAKKRRSSLQTAYSNLRKVKGKVCAGKSPQSALVKAKSSYIKKAVAKGQTRSEATKKANRVANSGCSKK